MKARARTALLGVLAACLGGTAWASPTIVEGVFEKRPYRLFLPSAKAAPAKRLLVFLHGMSRDPLRRDARSLARVIRKLPALVEARAVLFPTAKRGCPAFRPPRKDRHCWSNDSDHDLQYVDRLLHQLRTKHSLPAGKADIAGYSNGAYFLSKALQAGKLNSYQHVGLLAGGSPLSGKFTPTKGSKLRVCIEVAREDKSNAPWGRKLAAKLRELGYKANLATREVSGGHLYRHRRTAAFFGWFLGGCK